MNRFTFRKTLWALLAAFSLFLVSAEGENQEKAEVESSSVSLAKGRIVTLSPVKANGGIAVYINKKKNVKVPVFAMAGNMETTGYTLFVDSKPYRLGKLKSVKKSFVQENSSIGVTYEMQNLFRVKVIYSIQKMAERQRCENVSIKWSVENLSDRTHDFQLKYALDTVLSEDREYQYVSASGKKIKTETIITDFKKDPWVISSDGNNAMELVLSGKGIESPEKAVFANRNIVMESLDTTVFVPERSFNSLVSYNDSAVALFFRKAEILPEKNIQGTFLMAFSLEDFQMAGGDFDYSEDHVPASSFVPVEGAVPVSEVPEGSAKKIQEDIEGDLPDEKDAGNDLPVEEKYSEEHIRQLVEYINQLEAEDPELNSEKIESLEKEVDEILEYLRSKN